MTMKNLQFHLPLTDIHKSILSHRLFSHESLFLHFGWEIHQHFQFRAGGTGGQGGFALLSPLDFELTLLQSGGL